ncbi:MAG: hypothetical protein IJ338_05930 [Bacteroidaceae bacterium]|nr:hypothetical protein [Bacteroidaceae bacterium]
MSAKNLITSIGVSALLLGIGMNTHRAWNDHGIKEASLSQFVIGQGTTSSSTSSQCTERGGKELPQKVLQLERYIKEIHGDISMSAALSLLSGGTIGGISSGHKLEGDIVFGHQCTCKTPPTDYNGKLGCDLTWERVID